ncbi:MAG: tRNA 2-thiocytidine biosynthesis protein TtcA [Spirochaetales bacterium]|nr:tRNA 2-thiocytidine biosynthesis protein TtcA [Spirochaetales bacterium]
MITINTFVKKKISRALHSYNMIRPGDRILVAVSGGKDSMTLVRELMTRRRHFSIPFTIDAVHVKTDIAASKAFETVNAIMEGWGIRLYTVPLTLRNRVVPGKEIDCYWCSVQRRIEILKAARLLGCNKIALGHHCDDIIETFFINIVYKGKIETMRPVFSYSKYPFSIIRPLCLLLKRHIEEYVEFHQLIHIPCACPFSNITRRETVKKAIGLLAGEHEKLRYTIYRALEKNLFPFV